jgi:peptidoglycan/xylan/chitin deacetylase (PgdA/CDA1 family)
MKLSRSARSVVAGVCSKVPCSLLDSLAGAHLIIPYYHMVSDADVPHVKHLYRYKSVRAFREDLEFLLRRYTPIGLADLLDHARVGRRLPKRAVLLTYDDGFREMSDIVAPILTKKGVRATFFVNSAFVDNAQMCYLNKASLIVDKYRRRRSLGLTEAMARALCSSGLRWDDIERGVLSATYQQRALVDELAQIVELDIGAYLAMAQPYLTTQQIRGLIRDGFEIGAHSIDHPLYASLSLDEQTVQTTRSLAEIREAFRLNYGAFAFPHSDHHVSRAFFEGMWRTGLLDVSFGTGGLIDDRVSNHYQRFSLDSPLEAAERTLAYHVARRLARRLSGRGTIERS